MNYSKMIPFDIANGEGVRVSLFISGCNFHCQRCFNQEAQDFEHGQLFTEAINKDILQLLDSENIDGLSILGGDPLWQNYMGLSLLCKLCKKVHKRNKNVWLWSGFTWEQIFPEVVTDDFNIERVYRQELIRNCDVFVDGQFIEELKDLSLPWRGSSNQRVIDVKQSLSQNKVILYKE